MKRIYKYALGTFLVLLSFYRCSDTKYSMGDLTAPTNVVITTVIAGANTANPNGDGSGDVQITVTADNALSYKVDFDAGTSMDMTYLPTGTITKKYTNLGVNTYKITAVAYGKGGTSSTVTKDVTVKFTYTPDPSIVANLTGGTSKTWVVDKSVPGHFGVGPWSASSVTPEWWSAGVNEKVASANCFYTATFKFTKDAATNTFALQVTTPDGAFTKTGALTRLPGIPGSGDEACYNYAGGTAAFSFIPAGSLIPASSPSTQVSILLGSNNIFIGYGSLQNEYEILVITPTYLYLRAQGTETGNAWYIKMKPV